MTDSASSNDVLKAIGLGNSTLGSGSPLPPSQDDFAEGSTLRAALTLLTVLEGGANVPRFQRLDVPDAAAVGVSVAVAADRYLRFQFGGGGTPTLLAPGIIPDGAVAVDAEDPATIYLDRKLLGTMPVAAIRADGTGTLDDPRDRAHRIKAIRPAPLRDTALSPVSSPVIEWCTDLKDDWLRAEIEARAAVDSAWNNAAAAAMFSRFARPDSIRETSRIATALTQGEPHPFIEAVRKPASWFASITDDERKTIEDLAIARIDRLTATVDELQEEWDALSDDALEVLRDLCHDRDEMEAVRILILGRRPAPALDSALRHLDRYGILLTRKLGGAIDLRDERLRRVYAMDPSAWWAAVGCGAQLQK